MSDFINQARAEAEDYARTPRMNVGTVRDRIAEAHLAGALWARTHLAAQEPNDAEVYAGMTAAAQSMPAGWWGGTEWRRYVEEILDSARAARRNEKKRTSCGCDLTGPVPPAVHIVDRHEETR